LKLHSFLKVQSGLKVKSGLKDESGATAIEYGLIAGLIALVILSAVSSVGANLSSQFSNIANTVS
jgi:pilus assembly protein Flp/PilA